MIALHIQPFTLIFVFTNIIIYIIIIIFIIVIIIFSQNRRDFFRQVQSDKTRFFVDTSFWDIVNKICYKTHLLDAPTHVVKGTLFYMCIKL